MPSFMDLLMMRRKQRPDRAIDPKNYSDPDGWMARHFPKTYEEDRGLLPGEGADVGLIPPAQNLPLYYPDFQDPVPKTPRMTIINDLYKHLLPGALDKRDKFYRDKTPNETFQSYMDRTARTDSQLGMKAPGINFFNAWELSDRLRNRHYEKLLGVKEGEWGDKQLENFINEQEKVETYNKSVKDREKKMF